MLASKHEKLLSKQEEGEITYSLVFQSQLLETINLHDGKQPTTTTTTTIKPSNISISVNYLKSVAPWPGGPGGPWPPLKKICRMISMLVGNFEIYIC